MWLLLALMFLYMMLAHISALYVMVSYKVPPQKFKIWWLRNYQRYHKTRKQYNRYTQMLLDVFFKVDPAVNDATFGSSPRDRIGVIKVWRMAIEGDSAVEELVNKHQVLTWENERVPFEGGDVVEGAVCGDRDCLQTLLKPVVADAIDVTDEFRQMWTQERNGFISVNNDGFITYIEYSGYANSDSGIAAQKCVTVYTGPTILFPPKHPNTCAVKGIRVRQVLDATMDGDDVTGIIKSVAGPHSDFLEKDNPLTYLKLWIAFWFAGTLLSDDVVIEDTMMDETVF